MNQFFKAILTILILGTIHIGHADELKILSTSEFQQRNESDTQKMEDLGKLEINNRELIILGKVTDSK